MPPYGALGPAWHEILDKHQAALASDLAQLLSADRSEAVSTALADERAQSTHQIARACKEARRIQSESLNQSLRRLRLAVSEQKTLQPVGSTVGSSGLRS